MLHPHLLELSAWPWLERLSRREGRRVTLDNVPPRDWDAIAGDGFNFLYLMGVWQRSALGREIAFHERDLQVEYGRVLPDWTRADVTGSPFCIRAYEPDERMGGWPGLDAARLELNRRGVGLVLDFVVNHTAFDHAWVSEEPGLFVLGTQRDYASRPHDFRTVATAAGPRYVACGRDPNFPPWRDVAQLNHFNPATRAALVEALQRVAAHCDGVRCDMAMLVLNDVFDRTWRGLLGEQWPRPPDEFWPTATSAAPQQLFVAEVYWDLEWTLQQQGFHFTYDKRLLDRLEAAPTKDVRAHLTAEPAYADRLVRFLENHDEPRSAAVFGDALPAAAAMLATLPGMRFFFDGQMDGRRLRIPVQLGRWPDEPINLATRDLYARLLRVTKTPLFHEGAWRLLDVTPAGDGSFTDLIAWRWCRNGELTVVAVNLGTAAAQGHVDVAEDVPAGFAFELVDRLTDKSYRWTGDALRTRGLYVRLEPGQAHVFGVRAA